MIENRKANYGIEEKGETRKFKIIYMPLERALLYVEGEAWLLTAEKETAKNEREKIREGRIRE
jgi:hypothetical protein